MISKLSVSKDIDDVAKHITNAKEAFPAEMLSDTPLPETVTSALHEGVPTILSRPKILKRIKTAPVSGRQPNNLLSSELQASMADPLQMLKRVETSDGFLTVRDRLVRKKSAISARSDQQKSARDFPRYLALDPLEAISIRTNIKQQAVKKCKQMHAGSDEQCSFLVNGRIECHANKESNSYEGQSSLEREVVRSCMSISMKSKRPVHHSSESNLKEMHNCTISALKDKLSSSKKDLSKRMSVAGDLQMNGGDISQSCTVLSHAASMPALACQSCLQQRRENDQLRLDNSSLRRELKKTKAALESSLKSEKTLRDRLSKEAQRQITLSDKFEDVSLGTNRPTALIQQYGALYSQARVDALDSLDSLPQLSDLENLKNKLLFSVIVLSFRQCQHKVLQLKEQVLSTLCCKKEKVANETESATRSLEQSVSSYLRQSVDWFDIKPLTQDIQKSIYSTLYDYPCLKKCTKLRVYIEECVRIAWRLCVQNPPCHLEFDCKRFSSNKHVRFHSSNGDSDQVKSYIWPALLDSKTGACLYKGTLLT
ncbi:uncharacterized protein [Watersipora subatra]|uniref:uncharacterized protein n=1 Tax=Watersipora subatra TaxID=2589382 RepID=UPI00355BC4D5